MVLLAILGATLVSHIAYDVTEDDSFLMLSLVGMAIITCCAEVLL